MANISSDLKRYLAGEGYTGSLQDMWKQALATESATSFKSVQDLEKAFLEAQGLTGSLPGMWKEYLEGLGYTGSTQDMFRAAVEADGLFVAEATDVSLADVQQIYTDIGVGIGYLRDARIPSGLYSDAGTTQSVDTGLVQRAYNQSPLSGAAATYMEELHTVDMPTLHLGEGLYGTSASLFDGGVLPGLASEGVTLFVAAKGVLDGTGENDQLVSLYGANNFNLQLTGRPDGPGYRVYGLTLGTYVGSVAANADENGIVVLMLQLSADGNNVEVRCNNTLVLDTAITGTKTNLVNEHEYELRRLEFNNVGDRLLGWGVLPGKATDAQRQTICDYFQQNAGDIAPTCSAIFSGAIGPAFGFSAADVAGQTASITSAATATYLASTPFATAGVRRAMPASGKKCWIEATNPSATEVGGTNVRAGFLAFDAAGTAIGTAQVRGGTASGVDGFSLVTFATAAGTPIGDVTLPSLLGEVTLGIDSSGEVYYYNRSTETVVSCATENPAVAGALSGATTLSLLATLDASGGGTPDASVEFVTDANLMTDAVLGRLVGDEDWCGNTI